ncbi:pyridoxal phosphate biosynthetic protein PdxJ [Desulfarculus baarsii DSM 2075]|uniref:Pyridoxine 5'-phosphate synthase n=1 Tax=Desulfarculus baarsii (strain ATCC 33931 / DSM 2075 / LMG 7858 / VKM B-1802 / 2st14) TaxID=644282 RepID=E1QFI2_DESB2|nr:pyridoxine 5'-phosphate synthase [Desulfarculus baarsii]ADK84318.1 pyridoxal phosphate biosynthetic protein PdxJ [Desulfarculus baarsii DSM 2075]
MARLSVNVDHVATLRQARGIDEPDPVWAAVLAEKAGADGIIVHLREDRRHIQDRDLRVLRQVVKGALNMEMAATEEMIGIAAEVGPQICTLVPERRQELTTEGGLEVKGNLDYMRDVIAQLNQADIEVSLFIDPHPEQVKAAHMAGAQVVELHTGAYANAAGEAARLKLLSALEDAARLAARVGMRVAAGHGLNLRNVAPLLKIPEIVEYSIGHSIVARALFVGFESAVAEMLALVRQSAPPRQPESPARRL